MRSSRGIWWISFLIQRWAHRSIQPISRNWNWNLPPPIAKPTACSPEHLMTLLLGFVLHRIKRENPQIHTIRLLLGDWGWRFFFPQLSEPSIIKFSIVFLGYYEKIRPPKVVEPCFVQQLLALSGCHRPCFDGPFGTTWMGPGAGWVTTSLWKCTHHLKNGGWKGTLSFCGWQFFEVKAVVFVLGCCSRHDMCLKSRQPTTFSKGTMFKHQGEATVLWFPKILPGEAFVFGTWKTGGLDLRLKTPIPKVHWILDFRWF